MQITVDIPGEFAAELVRVAPGEFAEILTLGISEWRSRKGPEFAGLNGVLERLATLPEPQAVLDLRPTADLVARAHELLEKNHAGALSEAEELEWRRLELAEHLVRIAKAQAVRKLQQT